VNSLQISLCQFCGSVADSPSPDCAVCKQRNCTVALTVNPIGTLYTFTVIYAAPPGIATPYTIGYADFSERVRLFGKISQCDQLRVGMIVQLFFENGAPILQPLSNNGDVE
jgi:uncharacterized OB-fold protein